MKPLRSVRDFHAAIESGTPVIVIDTPTKVATLHPRPAACGWVTVENFERKVIAGAGATGSYWVGSNKPPDASLETRVCSKCG